MKKTVTAFIEYDDESKLYVGIIPNVLGCALQQGLMIESMSLDILSRQLLVFIFFLRGKFFYLSSNPPPFRFRGTLGKLIQADKIQTLHILQTELTEVIGRISLGREMCQVEQRLLGRGNKRLLSLGKFRELISKKEMGRKMLEVKSAIPL